MLTFLAILSVSAGAVYLVEAMDIECNNDQRRRFARDSKAAKDSYLEAVPGALRQF